MTEFITRFTPQQKWFIDGMTNQFSGYFDGEIESLSKEQLLHIIAYCMDSFSDYNLISEINNRWENEPDRDGIFQDLYDNLFDEDRDFFDDLSR